MIPPTTTAAPIPPCPRCAATHVIRSGVTHNGAPRFRCRAGGRRFIADPSRGPVPDHTKDLVRRRLAERLGLRAIARVTGLSRSWVQGFANELYRDEANWNPGPLKKSRAG